ncbi:MAG: carbamoyltransferase HypF, partial [Elusimicrobiota bacterium]
GETTENISLKFHLSISELILNVCKLLRELTRINKVTLSGGVFQKRLLLDSSSALLHANGFDLLTHKFFSPNDSSICTGQAIAAAFYR